MHDIQEVYPIEDEQFELIPHFIELNQSNVETNMNKEDRFIYIGRFVKENNWII